MAGACSASTPEQATRLYLEALAAGQSDVAWSLLSDSARMRLNEDAHRARVLSLTSKQKSLLREAARRPERRGYRVQWTGRGETLTLQHRGGNTWMLIGPLPRFYRQHTPRHALQTFTEAFETQDYDVLMRLVPAGQREGLDANILRNRFSREPLRTEVATTLKALAENAGGRALRKNGWRFEKGKSRVDLVLEGAAWRVSDVR